MLAFLKKRCVRWVLASILVILLGGGALVYWYGRASLADFVGIDLRTLDDTHPTALAKFLNGILPDQFPGPRTKLNRVLEHLFPKKSDLDEFCRYWRFEPWYVWRPKTKTAPHFVLFEGRLLSSIPGDSGARIHFLDSSGKLEGTSEFSTGYRTEILDAALIYHDIMMAPLIEIKAERGPFGGAPSRQIYGIFETRVALLRIENQDGKPIANIYLYRSPDFGPSPPKRSKAEWEELLDSPDPATILEALMWIGGHHRTEDHFLLGPQDTYEHLQSVRLVGALRNSPAVRKRIAELAVSENRWICEAAVLAQQQLPKKADR